VSRIAASANGVAIAIAIAWRLAVWLGPPSAGLCGEATSTARVSPLPCCCVLLDGRGGHSAAAA